MQAHLRDRAIAAIREIFSAGIAVEDIAKSFIPNQKSREATVEAEIAAERRTLAITIRALSGDRVVGSYRDLTRAQVEMLERVARCAPTLKKIHSDLNAFAKINVRDSMIADGAEIKQQRGGLKPKKLDPAFISKIRNRPYWANYSAPFLERAAAALHEYLQTSRRVVFRPLVHQIPITILDHFHNQTSRTTEQRQAQGSEYIRELLIHKAAGSSSRAIPFVPGSDALLALVGDDIFVIVPRPGLSKVRELKAVAHELRHIASRLESAHHRPRKAKVRTEEY